MTRTVWRQTILTVALGAMLATVGHAVVGRAATPATPRTRVRARPAMTAATAAPALPACATHLAALRQALEQEAAANRELTGRLCRVRAAGQRSGRATVAVRPLGKPVVLPDGPGPDDAAPARFAELKGRIDRLAASGDLLALLALLKDLADLGPAGYPAAIDLALAIDRMLVGRELDLRGERRLFEHTLQSERMTPLLLCAVRRRDTDPEFRRLALESLRASDDPAVVPLLVSLLPSEPQESVARCMAQILDERGAGELERACGSGQAGRER